jgi:N-methylhydantoinase A/oxoprolinase/acetone carboxylase beta subunit
VGPQSAGAEPGPACYGRGGREATVTDASIVLGLLDPAYFAGGTLRLDPALSHRAIEERVAKPLGLSVLEAALGIHRVVNVQMAEGIRLVSISRGVDPRSFALMPFGGGGALHATALARELGIHTIVVPRYPGVLCASGLLSAMIEHEASAAFMKKLAEAGAAEIVAACDELSKECAARMRVEGVEPSQVETLCFADICYVGQAHYIEVPLEVAAPGRLVEAAYERFCALHEQVYGHSTRSPARFVNLRVVQRAANRTQDENPKGKAVRGARKGSRRILLEGAKEFVAAEVYERDGLAAGDVLQGPAIVEQADTTTLIEPGWQAAVGANGVLILTGEK